MLSNTSGELLHFKQLILARMYKGELCVPPSLARNNSLMPALFGFLQYGEGLGPRKKKPHPMVYMCAFKAQFNVVAD